MTNNKIQAYAERLERLMDRQDELAIELYDLELAVAREADLGPKHTYLIAGENEEGDTLVKIGRAYDVEGRLRSLQIGSPVKLTLLRKIPFDCEKLMHKRFAALRRHGEWFEFSDDMFTANFVNQLVGLAA